MRTLPLCLALGLMTAAFVPLVLADEAREREHGKRWRDIPDDRRNAGLARAESHGMFSRLTMDSGGNVTGRFVSFHFAQSPGIVHYFTVKHGTSSAKFFDAVTPTPYKAGDVPFITGSVFRAPGPNITVRVHNNPVAQSGWHAHVDDMQVVFDLAENVTVGETSTKAVRLNLGTGHGHIVTNGNASITVGTGTVTVTLDKNEHVYFAAHPPTGPGGKFLHLVNKLQEKGILGGVYFIANGDGAGIADDFDVDGTIDVDAIRAGRLDITVESNATGPRVFVFIVDPDTIDGLKARLRAILDGQVLSNATAADDIGNGTDARVHAYKGEKMAVIMIRIPHFSTHALVIEDQSTTTTTGAGGSPTTKTRAPGFELGLIALAVVGLVVLRRRRV